MHFSTIISAAAFASPALAAYVLEDDYMKDFYGSFNFFNGPDPTHGFVKYVDEATARSSNLINASGSSVPVKWGVDTTNKDPEGRASIRLESKKAYNKGLIVIDVEHMPFGCGTWPAFWMFGPNWPHQGEIDILEGVNEQQTNHLTLHTSTGCTVGSDTSLFTGTVATPNCDVKAAGQEDNVGCSTHEKTPNSYGKALNDNGGGVYATEWTSDAISIWFFPRGSVPADATGDAPDPSTWGKPSATWTKSSCDVDGIFKDLNIIFDTTFCGDWAGAVWTTGTCASKAPTCNEYVRDNPTAFVDAFWSVNALKVYQNSGNTQAPAAPGLVSSAAPQETRAPVASAAPVVSASAPAVLQSSAAPVVPPVASAAPVVPPVAGQSSVAPVVPPVASAAPVVPPVSSAAPVVPPVASAAPVVPPVASTTPVVPPVAGKPVMENQDGTLDIPLGPFGTNGEGRGARKDGAEEDTPAEATPSVATSSSAATPVSTPTKGSNGGFKWPGKLQHKAATSGVAQPIPSFAPGNATAYPMPSIGTGIASGIDSTTEIWQTVYTTQVMTVPGTGAEPTEDTGEEPPVATVLQTRYQSVVKTADPEQQGQATPVSVASPATREARLKREQRKRMVQHNGRK